MQNKNNILNFLGLVQKAGKLVSGYDAVRLALIHHQAKVIIEASDLSANSKDKLDSLVKHQKQVSVLNQFTSAELSHALGKKRKIIAVTDPGFSKAIVKKMNEGE